MTEEAWYIGYADDLPSSIDGPYKTFEEAVEAAKELFLDHDHEFEEGEIEILVFKVNATLKMTKSVDVQVQRVG